MKQKIITILLVVSMLCLMGLSMTATATPALQEIYKQDFEDVSNVSDTQFVAFTSSMDATADGLKIVEHAGSKCLEMAVSKTWHAPAIDIFPLIKEAGAGEYYVTMDLSTDTYIDTVSMTVKVRAAGADDENSFIVMAADGVNYYATVGAYEGELDDEAFMNVESMLMVEEEDLEGTHKWLLMPDKMPVDMGATKIYIDNFVLSKVDESAVPDPTPTPEATEAPTATPVPTATLVPTPTAAPATSAPAASPTAAAEDGQGGSTAWIWIAAAVIVIGGAGAGIWIMQKNKKDQA